MGEVDDIQKHTGSRWARIFKRAALGVLAALIIGAVAAYIVFVRFNPPEPLPLTARAQKGVMRMDEVVRTYVYYVPKQLRGKPPLVMAFHPSGADGEEMRVLTAYGLDALADAHGFIVVYPDGYEDTWNGCCRIGPGAAEAGEVNDTGFVDRLIRTFEDLYDIDTSAVFAAGFSDGGHFVYRLALETPGKVAGIAAIGSSLPAEQNCDCEKSGSAVPVMIMNGTEDPVNPFEGGPVSLFGFEERGDVLSAGETAAYFSGLAGHGPTPTYNRYPELDGSDATWVECLNWESGDLPEVCLYVLHGGGHTIPQGRFQFPALYGATVGDIDAAEEMWQFFERQLQRRGNPGRKS